MSSLGPNKEDAEKFIAACENSTLSCDAALKTVLGYLDGHPVTGSCNLIDSLYNSSPSDG